MDLTPKWSKIGEAENFSLPRAEIAAITRRFDMPSYGIEKLAPDAIASGQMEAELESARTQMSTLRRTSPAKGSP